MNSGLMSERNLTHVGFGTWLIMLNELKALLEPLGISRYYTDDGGAYERPLEAEKH